MHYQVTNNNANTTDANSAAPNSAHSLQVSVPLTKPDRGLYVVATPIGNLGDITLRALSICATADIVYCENKRNTARMLGNFGVQRNLYTYNDHSNNATRHGIIRQIASGSSVALVSDAGTPLISDPGYRLVLECHAAQLPVYAIPGASSLTAAMSICGAPCDTFAFQGFLPRKGEKRESALRAIAGSASTEVVFERASRLPALASDFAQIDPQRTITIARELTKKFEQIITAPAHALQKMFTDTPPKGETVVIFHRRAAAVHAPACAHTDNAATATAATTDFSIEQTIHSELARGSRLPDVINAVRRASKQQGVTPPARAEIYEQASNIRLRHKYPNDE